jgi:hypothetical protein
LQDLASHLVKTFTTDVKHHAVLLASGIVAGAYLLQKCYNHVHVTRPAATSAVFACIGRTRTEINDRMRQRLMLMYASAAAAAAAAAHFAVFFFVRDRDIHEMSIAPVVQISDQVQATRAGVQRRCEGGVR